MLKIANWNLERITPRQKRIERIRDAISKISADIWILTETHKNVGPENANSVLSDELEGQCWSSIWTHYPITPLVNYVSDTERCTAAKIIHPKYGDLIIYATVLPWVGSSWGGSPWEKGRAFILALAAYQNDWRKLQLAYPDAVHIVAGDFNQSLVDWHYYGSNKIRLKLEQTMRERDMMIITAGNNDPVARDSNPHACIDHICISKKTVRSIISTMRFPDADKPDKRLSDHFGVVVELS